MSIVWFAVIAVAGVVAYKVIAKFLARKWAAARYEALISGAAAIVFERVTQTANLEGVIGAQKLMFVVTASVMKSFEKSASLFPQFVGTHTAETLALYSMADFTDVSNLKEIIFDGEPEAVLLMVATSQRLGAFLDGLNPPGNNSLEWMMIVRLCRDIHDRTSKLITQYIREAAQAA